MITASPLITPDLIASALTYEQYVQLSTNRYANGLSTSDDPHYNTPEILGYTKLNLHRMSRLNKLTVVRPELQQALAQVTESWTWLVLTESWCGDAAQIIPVLDRIAETSPAVTFRLLLRDQNPDLMNAYLTNGGRSIPKLICLRSETLTEVGTWGPRPAGLQAQMNEWRSEKLSLNEAVERAQRWYNADQTQSTQAELLAAVTSWSKISV
ncbi:thioredoxin family protein [Spirosoma fluminis]